MNNYRRFLMALVLPAFFSGCTVPGSYLSVEDNVLPSISANDSNDIVEKINVYPLTADKVGKYKAPQIKSKLNTALDTQIAQYEYKIGTGDILNVTIWDHPELTIPAGSYRSSSESGNWVHADGTIFYPYIGFVPVAGKNVTEVRAMLTEKLAKFIESPQVDVNVAAFRSKKTYITGAVTKPGQQFITNIPLTLLDAINLAGGLASDADWRNITLTQQGVEQRVSLYALMQRGDMTQNRLLKAGDIVHVPRNDAQKVFVMGEVNDPKLLKIDRAGMSLTEALAEVGGLNQLAADATGVFVVRSIKGDEGSEDKVADVFQLDITNSAALIIGTEFDLQPYDVVYVTAAPITRWNRVIGQLLPTITGFNDLTEGVRRVRYW